MDESDTHAFTIFIGSLRTVAVLFYCAYYHASDLIIFLYASMFSLISAVLIQAQIAEADKDKPLRPTSAIFLLVSFLMQIYGVALDDAPARWVVGVFGLFFDCAYISFVLRFILPLYEKKEKTKILKE